MQLSHFLRDFFKRWNTDYKDFGWSYLKIINGVYVIIDWHIEGANAENLSVAKDFYKEMAMKYGKNDAVLYEGWN